MDRSVPTLREVLVRDYGIEPISIVDAPRGFVAETYTAAAADGRRYFAKVISPRWDLTEMMCGLPVLEELHALGIDTISRPIRTQAGQLTTKLGESTLILFDYVEGRAGGAPDRETSPPGPTTTTSRSTSRCWRGSTGRPPTSGRSPCARDSTCRGPPSARNSCGVRSMGR